MKTKLKLTVLYDNNQFNEKLETDLGFSCLIETDEESILFDSGGNGKILLANMKLLGIDPSSVTIVFLSHLHKDHTGGIKDFLGINNKVKVYYPQSFPVDLIDIIKNSGAEPIASNNFAQFAANVFTLGEISGVIPEQSLIINSTNGLIVITGCAHPGIIQIINKVKVEFPDELIYMVLGGFHLHKLSDEEINTTAQKIYDMDILTVAPTHCTGEIARSNFKNLFGKNYVKVGAGKIVEI
ncbi:MAG: MBL fold metallo-hydrolase [Melioribacteraceae bacterium]|nr:MBL fold metallo-hydrolase [Melioribacteraceae bacterium]